MSNPLLRKNIHEWLCSIRKCVDVTNRWNTAQDLYKLFLAYINDSEVSFQSFLKKLKSVQTCSSYIKIKWRYNNLGCCTIFFFITNKTAISQYDSHYQLYNPPQIRRSTRATTAFIPFRIPTITTIDDSCTQLTPKDTRQNGNLVTICTTSEMSTQIPQSLANIQSPVGTTSEMSTQIPQSLANKQSPVDTVFPILKQYGISTDLSNAESMNKMQSILHKLEILGRSNELYFIQPNNTTAKPFFIPNGISSKQAYNNWERRGHGINSLLVYMSNQKINENTKDPIVVPFLLNNLSKLYPKSYSHHAEHLGYNKPTRMTVVETAAVLSEVAVGDKKLLNTLHKHLKHKLNGHDFFCPRKKLKRLTSRLPKLTCNDTMHEREEGMKKEKIGLAYVDTEEAIRIDMDGYLQSVVCYLCYIVFLFVVHGPINISIQTFVPCLWNILLVVINQ